MNSLATKRLNFWNNICEALSLVLGRNFFHWLNATSTLASISASSPIRVSTIPVSGYTYTCERKWKCWLLSCVRLFAAPWNVARQAPVSMGFSRQESWSGLPFPSSEDLPDPGIEPTSPALQVDSSLQIEANVILITFPKSFLPYVVVVQSLNCVWLFATPWTAAHQATLTFPISWSLLRLMSAELGMPSNHLICHHFSLLPSIFHSIRVFP